MRLIDMHCDTFYLMMKSDKFNLKSNSCCVDLEKMKRAGSVAQFFACFIYMQDFSGEQRWEKGYRYALEMLVRGKQCVAEHSDRIAPAYSYDEILRNEAAGKMSACFTLEEGGVIHGKMEYLEELYRQGIRLITLTWNYENCIGFPNSKDPELMKKGLKPFGIEVVSRLNELGIMIDVSHLSDGGFWDVMKHSKKPIVASHSNARVLCPHPRNLSDEMIKAMAEKGGIAGVNFYPYFLNKSGLASVSDVANHIWHMYQVGGEDFVAIGTDFDGFDDGELDIKHIGEMNLVYNEVKKRGFTERQMEKIWNGNILRVIKEQE